ncbi:hypothetical protein [Paraflavitalea pollutisoli]|uniref:hypothetical protein n=1 Tax=Paraflavitalea pollutisoli TaxID=3034143 RepID=UPI0023EB217E|nr:hypothetical protein [Paraflavitalea sp. H1-2-19X]
MTINTEGFYRTPGVYFEKQLSGCLIKGYAYEYLKLEEDGTYFRTTSHDPDWDFLLYLSSLSSQARKIGDMQGQSPNLQGLPQEKIDYERGSYTLSPGLPDRIIFQFYYNPMQSTFEYGCTIINDHELLMDRGHPFHLLFPVPAVRQHRALPENHIPIRTDGYYQSEGLYWEVPMASFTLPQSTHHFYLKNLFDPYVLYA